MGVEGKWWILYEEEMLDVGRSRLYHLRDGTIFDGRSGKELGTYEIGAKVTNLVFTDEPGNHTIIQLRTGSASVADVDACAADWTTSGFELYRASWPPSPDETQEEEWGREDWENEHFGMRVTNGSALRDGPAIRALHEKNVLELQVTVH